MKKGIILAVLFLFNPISAWADRTLLPVQGYVISKSTSDPLEGSFLCTFRIYNAETGSDPLVTSAQILDLDEGVYSASIDVPNSVISENESLFLGVTIGDDSEMAPRLEYFSTPFAKLAEMSDTASLADVATTALNLSSDNLSSIIGSGLKISGGDILLDTGTAQTWTAKQTFALNPADTTSANAVLRVNPATSDTNDKFLAIQDNGTDRLTVDKEGDVVIAGNLTVSGTSNITITETGDVSSVTAGSGLTGGGATGDVTLTVGAGTGITVNADDVAVSTGASFAWTGDHTFTFAESEDLAVDISISGSNSGQGEIVTLTNSSSSGTQYGLYLDNAASSGTTEALLAIDNSDTDTAATAAIKVIDAGGGFTNILDINGTLISATELALLDGGSTLGDITGVTAGSGLTDGGTSGAVTVNVGAGTGITVNNDDVAVSTGASFTWTNDHTYTFGAGDLINIDATTTANTGTAGVIDLNVGAGNAAVDGINVALTQNTGATAGTDATALEMLLTADDADGDMFGIVINAAATTNATTGSYEAAIKIDNAEGTSNSMTDAILVTSSSDGNITDGLDVSDAELTNAINIGVNNIIANDGSDKTISAAELILLDGATTFGDITGVTAGSGLTDGGTSGAVTVNVGAGTGITVNADDVAVNVGTTFSWTGNHTWTFGATELLTIDASTTANTGTAGVIDMGVAAGNAAVDAINLAVTQNDGATAATDVTGLEMLLTADDADGDMFGIVINAAATTNAASGSYEAGIKIDNAEGASGSMTDAILVTSSSDGNITDGLDVSDAELTNAINIGVNNIIANDGSDKTISAAELILLDGATTFGDITGVTAGSGLTDGGTSGSVTVNVGAGTGITVNADDVAVNQATAFSWTNDHTYTFGASDLINIDATTTDNTGTAGVLDINIDAGNAAVDGINLDFEQADGAGTGVDATALEILLTANDADADMFGISITAASTANAGADTFEAGLFIDNADATALSMSDAILVTSSGVSGGIIDGVDVSAANINNAINIGANDIIANDGSDKTISAAELILLDGQTTFGDITGVTAGSGLTDGGTSGSVTVNVGAGTGITVNADDVAVNQATAFSWTNDHTYTFGASDLINIDATTTDNTGTAGVLDINIDAGNAAVDGINLDFEQADGAGTGVDATALEILLTASDADGDMFGLVITGGATAAAGTGLYEAAIKIDNAENMAAVMTDGILITSSGLAAGITDAIDVSDSNIGNAINIGDNAIVTGNVAGTIGDSTTDSWTFTTDGTGTGEIVLPTGAIATGEISDNTIDFGDMEDTLDLDANLTLNQSTNTWTHDYAGTTQGTGFTYTADDLTTSAGMDINITRAHNADANYQLMTIDLSNTHSANAHTGSNLGMGLALGYTQNPAVGTNFTVMGIRNEVTADTDDTSVNSLLTLDNTDTSTSGSTVVTNALTIINSGNIAAGITNAINVADADITTDLSMQNSETIDNNNDDFIEFQGGSGSDDTDIRVDLDGTYPIFDSPTDLYIGFADVVLATAGQGVGTAAPEMMLQVTGGGLCVGSDANCNTDNNTEGTVYAATTAMTVYDVAENFPTRDEVTYGDIVVLDPSLPGPFVKKSTGQPGEILIGAYSEKPGLLLGGFNGEQYKEERQVAVALSGRIPIKVSLEGGPIERGDFLAPSSVPGVGKKAGPNDPTVGIALEPYDGMVDAPGEEFQVLTFVTLGYSSGNQERLLTLLKEQEEEISDLKRRQTDLEARLTEIEAAIK